MEDRLTLRQHRRLKGETIRSLAAKAEVATHTITRIEHGFPARTATYTALADALGIARADIREFVTQALAEDTKEPPPG